MKQLTQQLKSGKMEILEVPFPVLEKGQVLVKNHFSVISPGTEGKTVSDARKGYVAKAKSRQKEVKMVIESIKNEGFKKTYDIVMNKLNAPSPLGYSCAGEVIAVGEEVNDFKVGDRVACGGDGAVHAQVVSVNRNLCVKVPDHVELNHAAFSTLAAIAIQGIRQAELKFGENCTVVGLGIIGLLTVQILKAAGIKAIGVDLNQEQVKKAKEVGADLALLRNNDGIVKTITEHTDGYGTDAVIITAGTSSLDPVEFAGEISRKKGKVVIVGAVPTGFSRPNYYKKELDLRMSSSYGPGRYDSAYEDKGIDYPIGYVRFTENRNMQSFIDLLSDKKLDIQKIISHQFELAEAPKAYDLILERKEAINGVLLNYDLELSNTIKRIQINNFPVSNEQSMNIGFIGAGNFAQSTVFPAIKDKCSLIGVVTAQGNMSRYIAEKHKFKYCAESAEEIFNDKNIGTVFILTRHNTHAEFITHALTAGKNVVVEKPLAMSYQELEMVKNAYDKSDNALMLGFNRRFSPLVEKMLNFHTSEQKKSINIRVNAGALPSDHWVHDPEIGGGRIIGEACHFIDLAGYIAESKAARIQAFSLNDSASLMDTVSINIEYHNGSIATINYLSNGNKKVPKERIEVFSNGIVSVVNDFKCLDVYSDKARKKFKLKSQDKGHNKEFELTLQALKEKRKMPIPFNDIYNSTLLTLEAIRSIKEGRIISID